ncbi:MAG: hypothetical protein NT023_02955 [Armatimonadetes bacterium]|nr:hypothetical protein [Armatimonadota bacterium]
MVLPAKPSLRLLIASCLLTVCLSASASQKPKPKPKPTPNPPGIQHRQ